MSEELVGGKNARVAPELGAAVGVRLLPRTAVKARVLPQILTRLGKASAS